MTQETGIRQECPLSPYLLIVVMTTMFDDIKEELVFDLARHRVPGANFDEVMYADDTMCVSEDTKTMNIVYMKPFLCIYCVGATA